jgi:hypothetical protein
MNAEESGSRIPEMVAAAGDGPPTLFDDLCGGYRGREISS